jgi:hypothetical protein
MFWVLGVLLSSWSLFRLDYNYDVDVCSDLITIMMLKMVIKMMKKKSLQASATKVFSLYVVKLLASEGLGAWFQ